MTHSPTARITHTVILAYSIVARLGVFYLARAWERVRGWWVGARTRIAVRYARFRGTCKCQQGQLAKASKFTQDVIHRLHCRPRAYELAYTARIAPSPSQPSRSTLLDD